MIAQHAKYHKKCLVQPYDKARDRDSQEQRIFGEEEQVKDIAKKADLQCPSLCSCDGKC